MKLSDAVSNFSNKMERFFQAYPGADLERRTSPDSVAQKKLAQADFAFKKSVAETYKKYRFPYKTLGEDSVEAGIISHDEDQLLAAYNLFKAVTEANEKSSTGETFLKPQIITSLSSQDQYTVGENFIYLQVWLYFEQKAKDFCPSFESSADGNFKIIFTPVKNFKRNHRESEIFATLASVFYPGEK